jgi:hypothetical protein
MLFGVTRHLAVSTASIPSLYPRLETKIFVFVFSRKFRENFFPHFAKKLIKSCKNFRENFRFRESFLENFPLGMRIRIQEPLKCVSRSEHWWMLPKIFAKTIPGTKIFRENFRKNENFRENENVREILRETKFREN